MRKILTTMTEKLAIIDCGTNTFHLLIVELINDQTRILFKEKVAVKIGEGGINNKIIIPAAFDRALNALDYFAAEIKNQNVKFVHAFATSAFRNAANGTELRDQIKERTDISIEIISGEAEADLIFKGVDAAVNVGASPALVMDIGGGSVEFIIGSHDHILWRRSFEIGAQRLVDLFHKSDPVLDSEIQELNTYLDSKLRPLFEALNKWQPTELIGSSGTFDTLSDIHCLEAGLDKKVEDKETPLTLDAVNRIHHDLIRKDRSERMLIPGMIELRVDMIVVASSLLNFILGKHKFDNIRVSTHALKEGVLAELLKGELK